MRYLIISDIHSNLEALQAVLQYNHYDQVLMLGDIVGYAADPEETVKLIQQINPVASVRGNHDKVVAGLEKADSFVPRARDSARWNQRHLSAESLQYVRGLPKGPIQVEPLFSIAHGSPADEDDYLFPHASPNKAFKNLATPICFFGHTHIPTIFYRLGNATYVTQVEHPVRVTLSLESCRYLINPGSVGQPRDGDPRAAFLAFDTQTLSVEFFRVNYDIARAQQKIRAAGLPPFLAHRLARGM